MLVKEPSLSAAPATQALGFSSATPLWPCLIRERPPTGDAAFRGCLEPRGRCNQASSNEPDNQNFSLSRGWDSGTCRITSE